MIDFLFGKRVTTSAQEAGYIGLPNGYLAFQLPRDETLRGLDRPLLAEVLNEGIICH